MDIETAKKLVESVEAEHPGIIWQTLRLQLPDQEPSPSAREGSPIWLSFAEFDDTAIFFLIRRGMLNEACRQKGNLMLSIYRKGLPVIYGFESIVDAAMLEQRFLQMQ